MSKQKTWTAKTAELKSDWFVVDATDQVLGRLASSVAKILRGKHKPTFTPHLNTGDHVIIINASKAKVSGAKLTGKQYTRYTGYPGGLRTRTLQRAQERDPTFPWMNAGKGMRQHNTRGAAMPTPLRTYAGAARGPAVEPGRCPNRGRGGGSAERADQLNGVSDRTLPSGSVNHAMRSPLGVGQMPWASCSIPS